MLVPCQLQWITAGTNTLAPVLAFSSSKLQKEHPAPVPKVAITGNLMQCNP